MADIITTIDTHAHMQDQAYNADRDAVIAELARQGIAMICIGTAKDTSIQAAQLASQHEHIYATIGVHPHYCSQDDLSWVPALATHQKVVALGEFGLDYHYTGYDAKQQARVFEVQLQLAAQFGLPYIIHNRDATADVMAILRAHTHHRGIMHCFCGDARLADECVELGYHISFAGNLTYKNAHEIRAAAAAVPLDRLLIETDSPYLAPTPNRGKRNDPSQVVYVAKLLADIKGISQHELLAITKANTLALFDKIKIV